MTTRPSAGRQHALSPAGTLRAGSRKNCTMNTTHEPREHREDASSRAATSSDRHDDRDGDERPALAGDDRVRVVARACGGHVARERGELCPTTPRYAVRRRLLAFLLQHVLRAPRALSIAFGGPALRVASPRRPTRVSLGTLAALRPSAAGAQAVLLQRVLGELRDDDEREQQDDHADPAALGGECAGPSPQPCGSGFSLTRCGQSG